MDEENTPALQVGNRISKLSVRQRQCLQGVLALKPAKRIAHDLGITPSAVEKHLRQARDKLGVASTAEAGQIFAGLKGEEIPHCGISHLAQPNRGREMGTVLQSAVTEHSRLEDIHPGVLSFDYPLSPLQTLTSIFVMSAASIIGLLLLISCAKAFESILAG